MILQNGDLVLVAHRRLFKEDQPRFFLGSVDHCEDGLIRVTGHTWYREIGRFTVKRKEGLRTKVLSVASGSLMLYVLDTSVPYEDVTLENGPSGEIWLSDGQDLKMSLAEREPDKLR